MAITLFKNARIFDGESAEIIENGCVVVEDDVIREVSDRVKQIRDAEVVDCAGHTLMPGMIDAHVHVLASNCNLTTVTRRYPSYNSLFAARFLRHALDCGFTTVRDAGGADVGLANAIRDGLIESPRLYYAGRIISQTGGHGDFRPSDEVVDDHICGCCPAHNDLATLADGVPAVRRAIRSELRRGAAFIKIMGSGGVASPSDPLERCQFSEEEVAAAVDEARRAGVYVAAHCHPSEAIERSVRLGVKSIEHGTLIDEKTAAFVARQGAFVVPTMAVIFALSKDGAEFGLPEQSLIKLRVIAERALTGLEIMRRAGVKMGLGTDLLGPHYDRRCTEFSIRREVLPALDVLRSACSVNADLMGEGERLGRIKAGAAADLLVVEGDPLRDVNVLAQNGRNIRVIMKAGVFHRRRSAAESMSA